MEVCSKWVCTSLSSEDRRIYDFDTETGILAGAEVTEVYFGCQDRQQLRSLLQKYSKIDTLYLMNTKHAAVISEFRHIVSVGFETENHNDCEQLGNIVSLTHLQSLSVCDCMSGEAQHFPWTTFSAMTYLSLGETDCGPDSRCKLPSALQVLHLSNLPGPDCLQDLPALTELHVQGEYMCPEVIGQLTRLTNLAVALHTPDESDSPDDATKDLNDAMFRTIATLLNLRVLLVDIHPSDFQVHFLSALTNLTELEFDPHVGSKPQCSLMAVQHLCCMSNLQQLHNLHFSSHSHYYQAATHCMLDPGMFIVSPASALRLAITDVTRVYTYKTQYDYLQLN